MILRSTKIKGLSCFVILLTSTFCCQSQTIKSIVLKDVKSLPMPATNLEGLSFFMTVNEKPEILAATRYEVGQPLAGNVLTATLLGKGKVIAFGSSIYFRGDLLKHPSVRQLFKNIFDWVSMDNKSLLIAHSENTPEDFTDYLTMQQAAVYKTRSFDLKKNTTALVLIGDVREKEEIARIEAFVRNGGTLIFASPFTDRRARIDDGKTFSTDNLLINKLLLKAGLFNFNAVAVTTPTNKELLIDSIPDFLHVNTMLPGMLKEKTTFEQFVDYFYINPTLEFVFANNEIGSPVLNNIRAFFKVPDVLPIASPAAPLEIRTPAEKIALDLAYRLDEKKQDYKNHPEVKASGAATFPGEVPKTAARIKETISIPVKVGKQGLFDAPSVYYRPHSTGLYIAAGEKVKIILKEGDLKLRLKAQIGVHEDRLTHLDVLKRTGTDLTRTFELLKETTEVYSPYGGLLMINIGDDVTLKSLTIQVDGAVKAPYFKLGETSEVEWNTKIRNYEAPWAELATDNIVLTVPSYRIRKLDNPAKLMQFWDEVMDADADLSIISRKRVHQERIIVDQEVAYGYMFTTQKKIIVPDDESCEWMLSEDLIRSKGSWGAFHEIGHRHQFWELEYPGVGEVTVNLYSMYVYDKVLKKGIYNHENISSKAAVIQKIKTYLADEPSYEKWSSDPFLALCMYIQIIEQFGWDAIKSAHTVYRNLPKEQYPKSDQDKRDLWFASICKATNSNLSRFFDTWRVPVTDKAKQQVASYPVWFPAELEAK